MWLAVLILCSLGIPVATVVRATFRRYGALGFGVAYATFLVTSTTLLWLRSGFAVGVPVSLVLPFVVVWALGRRGFLLEV